mgnify:FL=1|jgi:hypothetical protein
MVPQYIMEDKTDVNCEELTKKMKECLEEGDNDKCVEFIEAFDKSCKVEEKKGLLSWFSGDSKTEESEKDEKEEKKE